MKTLASEAAKANDDAAGTAEKQSRQASSLNARIGSLKDELDWLQQKESTGCDAKAVFCKAVTAKCKLNGLVDGVRGEPSSRTPALDIASSNR